MQQDVASEAENFCKAQPGAQTRVVKRQSKKNSESVAGGESALFSSAIQNTGYVQVLRPVISIWFGLMSA